MQLDLFLVGQDDKPLSGFDFQSQSYNAAKVYRHGYGFALNIDEKATLRQAAQEAAARYLRKFSREKPLRVEGVRVRSFFDVPDLDRSLAEYFEEGDTVVVVVDRRPNYKSPVPAIMKFLVRLSFLHVLHIAIISVVFIFGVRNRFAIGNFIQKLYGL